MHLHSLTLRAVGPFPGEHRIDFAELGAAGIFLLEGPTGAGKSTIIDAVVFALYGKVASEAASEDRLRSAYAGDDVESFVDLVFETRSGVYRVRRTPAFERAKRRGTGTTTQQAGVRLWRLPVVPEPGAGEEPAGELLSARLDEAGLEIQRAVGLDRRQFVQTVVLPQGEFASFLRADPEKRKDLLQKVFGTEVYDRVQAQLAQMQRDTARAVAGAREAARGAVEHFVGAAGLTAEDAHEIRAAAADDARLRLAPADGATGDAVAPGSSDGGSPGVGTDAEGVDVEDAPVGGADVGEAPVGPAVPASAHALARGHVVALRAESDELAAHELAASSALVAARDALEEQRSVAASITRRDALRAERDALAAREPEVGRDRERVAAAGRAAVVGPVLDGLGAARREAAAAREALLLARAGVPERLADADAAALDAVRAEVLAAAVRLERLRPVGDELPRQERELEDGRKEVARAHEERARIDAEVGERPDRRDGLAERVAALTERASGLALHQERVLACDAVLVAAREAESTQRDLVVARAAQAEAAAVARAAVDTERDVRAARIAGIAGELAAGLGTDDPCPVCGATEHPRPAGRDGGHVSSEDVETAERARAAAEQTLGEARALVDTLAERLDARRRAAGGASAAEALAALDAARADVEAARTATAERADAVARLEDFDRESAALAARHAELGAHVAGLEARLAALAETVERQRGEIARELDAAGPLLEDVELPDVLGEGPDAPGSPANPVAVIEAALRARARAVDEVLEAEEAMRAAAKAVRHRSGELDRVLAQHGFASAEEARAARLPDAERARVEADVARHDAARSRVEAGLAEPALRALAEDAVADVETARATLAEAEREAKALAKRHGYAQERADAAARASDGIVRAVTAWEESRAAAAPVARMATLASGAGSDNARALSLATFVLVRRFEDVVAAANERLLEMSGGRYELVRSDEREDVRTRRTGLAMKVVDHRTEAARDPRTLSGGETFYVSLCLALGLADVVAAEAGGVDLGTLFVDEGFGTLDPETLDAVLAELGRLRAGGRTVGVVSHVEALKQSIAERIEVRRLPGGASTLSVRAG